MHVTATDEKKDHELEKESRKQERYMGGQMEMIWSLSQNIKEITHKHKYSNQVAISY